MCLRSAREFGILALLHKLLSFVVHSSFQEDSSCEERFLKERVVFWFCHVGLVSVSCTLYCEFFASSFCLWMALC